MECPQCYLLLWPRHHISSHLKAFSEAPLYICWGTFSVSKQKSQDSQLGVENRFPQPIFYQLWNLLGSTCPHEAALNNLDALCLPVPSAPHRSQGPSILHFSSEKQLTQKSRGICHNFHPKSFSNKEAWSPPVLIKGEVFSFVFKSCLAKFLKNKHIPLKTILYLNTNSPKLYFNS